MDAKLSVGSIVMVTGRGPGMLELDNENGTWSVGFKDGSDGDIAIEEIEMVADQSRWPAVPIPGGAKFVSNPSEEAKPDGWTRFVCFSDTHGLHGQIPPAHLVQADVLLHAGDFTNTGEVEQVRSFAEWLQAYPAAHKVVIAGNHDITMQPSYYKDAWQRFHQAPYPCEEARQLLVDGEGYTYLEDLETDVLGYKIYGSPWQPQFCDWAFNLERGAALKEKWDQIPAEVDILMTHGPPHGMNDRTSQGAWVGCHDLLHAINERVVSVSVAGHVHEGYGVTTEGATLYVNASTCTHAYRPTNPPIVFDLPPAPELRAAMRSAKAADLSH